MLVKKAALEQRSQLGDVAGPFTVSKSWRIQSPRSFPITNILVKEGSSSSRIWLEGCSLDTGAVQLPRSCCSSANPSCCSRALLCLCLVGAGGFRPLALPAACHQLATAFGCGQPGLTWSWRPKGKSCFCPSLEVICCPRVVAHSKATAIRFVWHNKHKEQVRSYG